MVVVSTGGGAGHSPPLVWPAQVQDTWPIQWSVQGPLQDTPRQRPCGGQSRAVQDTPHQWRWWSVRCSAAPAVAPWLEARAGLTMRRLTSDKASTNHRTPGGNEAFVEWNEWICSFFKNLKKCKFAHIWFFSSSLVVPQLVRRPGGQKAKRPGGQEAWTED